MSRAGILFAIALCLSCKKSAPPAAPPAPAPAQAKFCDQDLSGVWLNANDRHFAYRFRDHGDVIRGEFLERTDAGELKTPEEPISFEFRRTATTLQGAMRSSQRTQDGRDCPVEFGIDITSCKPDSFQAAVEMDTVVGEDCKRKTAEDGGELPSHRTEYVFVRDTTQRPDAGTKG